MPSEEILTHPYRVFRFKVAVDSVIAAVFKEVSGLEMTVDVVEYRNGAYTRNTFSKIPGLTRYSNVTLTGGILNDFFAWDWICSVATTATSSGTGVERKSVTITLIDDTGKDGPQWELINAWPASYRVGNMDAMTSEIALESLELAHEGFSRIAAKPAKNPDVGAISKYTNSGKK